MKLTFTLDTNCLIDLFEGQSRKDWTHVKAIVSARDEIDLACVAISASEKQKDGVPLKNFSEFEARLEKVGLAGVLCLKPIGYWDVTFKDHCVYRVPGDQSETQLHKFLFQYSQFEAPNADVMDKATYSKAYKKWRNEKCDLLAFWSHWKNGRQYFVTSDENFHAATKKPKLEQFANCKIVYPSEVVALISPRP